jgi:hypothetical protein
MLRILQNELSKGDDVRDLDVCTEHRPREAQRFERWCLWPRNNGATPELLVETNHGGRPRKAIPLNSIVQVAFIDA